jgi:hypothetical protein
MTCSVVPGNGSFVKPHFIEELGGEGLTLHEVAQSIGVEFNIIKTKLDRMVSDNRLKTQYLPYERYNENNKLVKSYYLAVDTAKFFVAKWDSETGDAYCRFLINCEQVLTELSPELRYLIKIEQQQRQQQKALEVMQATVTAANDDSTLKATQIAHLENLFSQLRRVSGGDHKLVSRTKSALKAQFLTCNKAGLTYKDVAARHFDGCVAMVEANIKQFA